MDGGDRYMGLIEKRLIKEAKDSWLPAEQKEIGEIAGGTVTLDINWASFESDEVALKNLHHLGVRKITNALRAVCTDDLGKEAVREQIKRIVVNNLTTPADATVTLENGAVTLSCTFRKGSDGCLTDLQISRALERAL
jgi:hypothetical protein